MSKRTLTLALVLVTAAALVFGTLWRSAAERYKRAAASVSARPHEIMLLSDREIRQLMRMGLEDPVDELRHDLVLHPELIPYKGVLGGTMGFTDDSIALLSTPWALAQFEDGHIGGRCLLSYEVGPGGRVSWKVIAATLDQ